LLPAAPYEMIAVKPRRCFRSVQVRCARASDQMAIMSGPADRGRQLRAPALVGRRAELAVLQAEVERARAGEFRCLLLPGEPGVGKTRLARELLGLPQMIGLLAAAYPWGSTTPFGMWAEALEGYLRDRTRSEVVDLCAGFLDDLGGLLRTVAAARGRAPGRDPPRARLLQGLAALLGNLARRVPVVVVFDDAHEADASSWEALAYLARCLPSARVLFVATARPVELADSPVATDALLALEQENCLRRLPVEPLSADGLRELAAAVGPGDPPSGLVEWLGERTRGNPLFALALLQALTEEGGDPAAPSLRSLPEAVTARVTSRMRRLGVPAVEVLERLAVMGRPVELRSLIGLTGHAPDALSAILAVLLHSGLVSEEERGRDLRYEIAHPLVRDAIYQRIGGARRQLLHREIGRGLLGAGRLGEAAPHIGISASPDDTQAIDVLCSAARQAEERQAYREALEILGSLTDLLPAGDPRWRGVVDALSWQPQWVVDHRADAHARFGVLAMRRMDAVLTPLPEPAVHGAVKFRLASFLAWGTGSLVEAEGECRAALRLFKQAGDQRSALLAEHELAFVRGLRGNLPALRTGASRVADAAAACGDEFVLRRAARTLAMTELICGRFADAHQWGDQAMELARRAGDRYTLLAGLATRAQSLALEGRIAEAWRPLGEAEAIDAGWQDYWVHESSCTVYWLAGEFSRAVSQGERALSLIPAAVSKRRAFGLACAALSAAEAGDLNTAATIMDRVRPAYIEGDWFFQSDWIVHVDAMLRWRAQRPQEALTAMCGASERSVAIGALPVASMILGDVAEVAALDGDLAATVRAARELNTIAGEVDRDLYRGLAEIAAAWAALASGDGSGAAGQAQHAVDLLSGLGYHAFCGRALDVLGRALSSDSPRRAVPALKAAAETFGACGAVWRRHRVVQRLRKLGPPARTAVAALSGPSSLTRREREVARLAAAGSTAREIGERLFIGERTVEGHLARIYAKLGVGSKLQLVARAAEFGLTGEE
jgi:DNA-binding CsgD family transcriptional regulator/tetratricopeptide (TPR) repeat protein